MRVNNEDITLFCIADEREKNKAHWLTLWKKSYPLSCDARCSAQTAVSQNIETIQIQFKQIESPVFIVAHSYGVIAFLAWLAQTSLLTQKSIVGALLVAPPVDDEEQISVSLKEAIKQAYANFPTTLVGSEEATSETQVLASAVNARFYFAREVGYRNNQAQLGTWEKGMVLMQTMLLND